MTDTRIVLRVAVRVLLIVTKHWYALHADRLSREEEHAFLDDIRTLEVFDKE